MLALALTADLSGWAYLEFTFRRAKYDSVTDLLPLDTSDEPYFYTFKVQCTSCRETHPNWISVNRHVCIYGVSVFDSEG